ncbi:MAG: RNA polymerase subunit sigma-70 [Minicystis sp.]
MPPPRTDEELVEEVLRHRAAGTPPGPVLGELCERWRRAACFVVRRIQASYGRGAQDDELEVYQEAVRKLVEKGLEQFRGEDENEPGRQASLRVFFLRIVKHQAIDRYRAKTEELAREKAGEEAPEVSLGEAAQAMAQARAREERNEATELYWAAYERLEIEHPNEASVWKLYHHEGADDHAECAAALSISVVNSYKRLSRAQAYLKLYLLDLQAGLRRIGAHHE